MVQLGYGYGHVEQQFNNNEQDKTGQLDFKKLLRKELLWMDLDDDLYALGGSSYSICKL